MSIGLFLNLNNSKSIKVIHKKSHSTHLQRVPHGRHINHRGNTKAAGRRTFQRKSDFLLIFHYIWNFMKILSWMVQYMNSICGVNGFLSFKWAIKGTEEEEEEESNRTWVRSLLLALTLNNYKSTETYCQNIWESNTGQRATLGSNKAAYSHISILKCKQTVPSSDWRNTIQLQFN